MVLQAKSDGPAKLKSSAGMDLHADSADCSNTQCLRRQWFDEAALERGRFESYDLSGAEEAIYSGKRAGPAVPIEIIVVNDHRAARQQSFPPPMHIVPGGILIMRTIDMNQSWPYVQMAQNLPGIGRIEWQRSDDILHTRNEQVG